MRIGIIADALDAKMTGISSYTHCLISALPEIDFKNEYFIIHHKLGGLPFKAANFHELVIPTSWFDPNRTISRLYSFRSCLDHYKLDILHDLTGSAIWFNRKQINIQSIHDASCFTVPESHTFINRLINNHFLKRTISSIDHVITDSYASKKDIGKYLNIPETKISVIYLAADSGFSKLTSPDDLDEAKMVLERHDIHQPFIFSLGALVARKNLITLIKSFLYLKEHQHIPHKLVLTGMRPKRSKKLSGFYDNHPDIIFTGYVPNRELVSLYNSASCFVFPSLYEGFGLPVLEAMQCGCPVITSNVSSLPEVVGDAGLLLKDPLSVIELNGLIMRVISDQALSSNLSIQGLIQAKKFSWRKCAQGTLAVYQSVINSQK